MKRTDLETSVIHRDNQADPDEEGMNDFPGYNEYPPDEDIYSRDKQESGINPEDISGDRTYPKTGVQRKNEIESSLADIDLDIPGADLDDELEEIGSEDEENNYYSITDNNFDELEDLLDR